MRGDDISMTTQYLQKRQDDNFKMSFYDFFLFLFFFFPNKMITFACWGNLIAKIQLTVKSYDISTNKAEQR